MLAANLYDLDRDAALTEVLELSVMRLGLELVSDAALSFLLPYNVNVRRRAYTVWLSQHDREDIQVPRTLLANTAVLHWPRAYLELIVPEPPFDRKFRACSALWRTNQR